MFSWDHSKSKKEIETMLMQNFGATNKEFFIWYFESGLFQKGILFDVTSAYVV